MRVDIWVRSNNWCKFFYWWIIWRSFSKIDGSYLGESLGVESGTEVGSSFGLSGGCVERKLEGSSGGFERGASGARV